MSYTEVINNICGETRWRPYHSLLADLEKRVLETVTGYAEERCPGECQPIAIVAPYGSGKSEFAKHLCHEGWSRGIPVLIVNLSDIDSHLELYMRKRRLKHIKGDDLTSIVEEFVKQRLLNLKEIAKANEDVTKVIDNYLSGRTKGVLIIDEIEETFEEFKKKIKYETTPWRRLFDDMINRKTSFALILLYGPSSALSESIRRSGLWRARVESIPLMNPDSITELLKSVKDSQYKKLLANTLFWLGKGRIGLIMNTINNRVVDGVFENIEKAKSDRNYLNRIESLYQLAHQQTLLVQEIVENVPLMDVRSYMKHLNETSTTTERNLLKILVALVGPIPARKLGELIDLKPIGGVKLSKVVRSRYYIPKSKLVDVITEFAEDLLTGERSVLTVEDKVDLEHLRHIVDAVYDAWSYNDVILISRQEDGFGTEPLKRLKDAASAIALEMYRENVANILNKIDIERVIEKLRNDGYILELHDDEYYSIHPAVILDVYPPIMVRPLISCSKNVHEGALLRVVRDYVKANLGRASDELLNEILRHIQDGSLDKVRNRFRIYLLVNSQMVQVIGERIIEDIMKSYSPRGEVPVSIIVPLSLSDRELATIKSTATQVLEHLVKVGLVAIPDVDLKLSLFLHSIIYCLENCRDDLVSLKPHDRFIAAQYANAFAKAVLLEGLKVATEMSSTFMSEISKELESIKDKTRQLLQGRGREVGSEQAKYFWIVASLPKDSEGDLLKGSFRDLLELLEKLDEASRHLAGKLQVVSQTTSLSTQSFRDALFKEISLLTDKRAQNYYQKTLELHKILDEIVSSRQSYSVFKRLVNELVEQYASDLGVCSELVSGDEKLMDVIEQVKGLISNVIKLGSEYEPALYMIIARELSDVLDALCANEALKMMSKQGDVVKSVHVRFGEFEKVVAEFRSNVDGILSELRSMGISEQYAITARLLELQESLSRFDSIIRKIALLLNNTSDKLRGGGFFVNKLFEEFILGKVVNTLSSNLSTEVSEPLKYLKARLDNIYGLLRESGRIRELVLKLDESFAAPFRQDVANAIKGDVSRSLKTADTLDRLEQRFETYVREVSSKIDNILKTIREVDSYTKVLANNIRQLRSTIERL